MDHFADVELPQEVPTTNTEGAPSMAHAMPEAVAAASPVVVGGTPMPIAVTQNADGSLLLTGATTITLKQVAGGVQLTANDVLTLPVDTGPALRAKIVAAQADLAKAAADLARVGTDLA